MDVSVTNGLEGVRQYFQGLPTTPTSKAQQDNAIHQQQAHHNLYSSQQHGNSTNNWQQQPQPYNVSNQPYQITEKPKFSNHVNTQLPKHEMRPANHEIWKAAQPTEPDYHNNGRPYPGYENSYPVAENQYYQAQENRLQNDVRQQVKSYDMRPPSMEMRPIENRPTSNEVRSHEIRSSSHEMRQHEMRPQVHEVRSQSYEMRVPPQEIRAASQETRVPSILPVESRQQEIRRPHEMRPQSHEMRPPSLEMRPSPHSQDMRLPPNLPVESRPPEIRRPASHEIRQQAHDIRPQLHEMRPQSHGIVPQDIRPQSLEMRPQSHEMRPQSHEMRPQSHEMRPQSHEMRPPSHEMRPLSHEMRPPSHESRPQSHEMRPPSLEMRPPSHEMRPQSHEIRPPSHDMRPQSHEMQIRQPSHEMRPQSHEMRPPSLEMRPSVHEMRSQDMRVPPISHVDLRQNEVRRPASHEMRPQSCETRLSSLEIRVPPVSSESRPQEVRARSQESRPVDRRYPTIEMRPIEMSSRSQETRPPSLEIRLSPQERTYQDLRFTQEQRYKYPQHDIKSQEIKSEMRQQIRSISNEIRQLSQEIRPLAQQNQTIRPPVPEMRLQERHPTLQDMRRPQQPRPEYQEPKVSQPYQSSHELVRSQHHAAMMKSSQDVVRFPYDARKTQYPSYGYPVQYNQAIKQPVKDTKPQMLKIPNYGENKVGMTTPSSYPGYLQTYNMHLENPKPATVYYERTDSVEITKISSVEKRVLTHDIYRDKMYQPRTSLPYHDMQRTFNDMQHTNKTVITNNRYDPKVPIQTVTKSEGYYPPQTSTYPKFDYPEYVKKTDLTNPAYRTAEPHRNYQPPQQPKYATQPSNDISISVVPAPQQYSYQATQPRYCPKTTTSTTQWPQLAFKTSITTIAGQSNYTSTASSSAKLPYQQPKPELKRQPITTTAPTVPKIRRESPLDLSVKTVKSSADSSDDVYILDPYYRPPPRPQAPSAGIAPRIDFAPNFNTPPIAKPAQYPSKYNNRTSYYHNYKCTQPRAPIPTTSKRPAENDAAVVPTPKIPKTEDNWRQSIDQQIEQRLQSYTKMQEQQKQNGHPKPVEQDLYISRKPTPNIQTGTGADKRVLSLLRNSLEIKEAQKREQELLKAVEVTIIPTAETNGVPPKFHIPRAIDSIKYEEPTDEIEIKITTTDKADLDGLAANLAARIRTKAELKQIDPAELQKILEKVNPPLLEKIPIPPPRRRLFSRTEEDASTHRNSVLRSSSETSVFDFRDSDSESEMPVLERQSFRKSSKTSSATNLTTVDLDMVIKTEPMDESVPTPDPFFTETCDKFLEQLRSGTPLRKRGRKKKTIEIELKELEPEPVQPIEPAVEPEPIVVKTEPAAPEEEPPVKVEPDKIQQLVEVKVKVEKLDLSSPEMKLEFEKTVIKTEPPEEVNNEDSCDSDVPLIQVKKKVGVDEEEEDSKINSRCEVKLGKIKMELSSASSSEESDSEHDKEKQTETVADRLRQRKCRSSEKQQISDSEQTVPNSRTKESKCRSKSLPQKKPYFGDGSDFRPGWEEEVYRYKQSLRMPAQLINISRPARISTSLPDLDPCPSPSTSSITDSSEFFNQRRSIIKNLFGTADVEDSNSSFSTAPKITDDFEDATSSSISEKKENNNSIVDVLAKRYSRNKRKKVPKTPSGPKIIPKSSNPLELLPTPSLDIETSKKLKTPKAVVESANLLGFFRKKTVENFRDAFRAKNTIHEQFTPIVFKTRTRKETQVLKKRATIREVFGEERPASAPPMTNHQVVEEEIVVKVEPKEEKENKKIKPKNTSSKKEIFPSRSGLRSALILRGNRSVLRTKRHINKSNKKRLILPIKSEKDREKKSPKEDKKEEVKVVEKTIEIKVKNEVEPIPEKMELQIKIEDIKEEIKESEPVLTAPLPVKKKYKLKSMRRKFSSGFDYIRKKKKQVKKPLDIKDENVDDLKAIVQVKPNRRTAVQRPFAESVHDIQREIKGWVLNKGIGETHLHRAARLGYTDVIAYCLETANNPPSPRDNAGYTPLHEACSRGHLDIAKLLLLYGANVHESAQGGIRPLHEASENGFVEIIRLLLSYGADPLLATYSGHTPLSLATEPDVVSVLENYIADVQGKDAPLWCFYGPDSCFDKEEELGYDPLEEAPDSEPPDINTPMFMEISDNPLPNFYTLRSQNHNEKWVLLQDLYVLLKVKSREALLRLVNPNCGTTSHKNVLKEMKMNDFLEDAYCCALLGHGERVNIRASKIALIKYTDRVRELLGVENYYLPVTKS